MFDFLKRNKTNTNTESNNNAQPFDIMSNEENSDNKKTFFQRLKQGLKKTRNQFSNGVGNLILGKKIIDATLLDDLEAILLSSDLGVVATQEIIKELADNISRKQLDNPEALVIKLKQLLIAVLKPYAKPLNINSGTKPYVILVVGVNGVGKTTTIGKLAKYLQLQGKKVMLAAGDTFRAAAIEQLQIWGERNNIPVIYQQQGADSASVIFDALQAAKARNIDVLIADTAGRLHTKANLLEELKKIRRVLTKIDVATPQEILLVLDAGNGQNALAQAQQFQQTIGVTGLALTKLDGTAKGGIIFAIAKTLAIPIRFIGVGEGVDDLREFNAEDFVKALFAEEE